MGRPENETIVRRWFDEVVNQKKLDATIELNSPDFQNHDPNMAIGQQKFGPEGSREYISHFLSAFPDAKLTIEDTISDGDKVVTRFSARGTHTGGSPWAPPSGKSVVVEGISIAQIENEKISRTWVQWNATDVVQQLGIIKG